MTDELTDATDTEVDLGTLYWDTNTWKTYAPYRAADGLVYMVTVRSESELADAIASGTLRPHEESLGGSEFDTLEAIDSFRLLPDDEAETLRETEAEES